MKKILTQIDEHIAIFGETRSGKTYLGNKLHANREVPSIFFHYPDKKTDISGYGANAYEPVKALRKAIEERAKVNYLLHKMKDVALNEVRLSYNIMQEKGGGFIFLDEAHRFVEEGGKENVIDFIVKEGLKYDVHLVLISQSPVDVKKSLLRQINRVIFFKVNNWSISYLSEKHLPADSIKERTRKKYSFIMIKNGEIYPKQATAFKIS